MGRVGTWVAAVENFQGWGGTHEASETQTTAAATEKHLSIATESVFSDAWVKHLGSQQHPDFLVANRLVQAHVEAHALASGRKVTQAVMMDWEATQRQFPAFRFVRLEAKAANGDQYTLNDTFPKPLPAEDEIYVLFSAKARRVVVSTSATMAAAFPTTPPIADRYISSKTATQTYGGELRRIWQGTPVTTAPRPTYRVTRKYAEVAARETTLASLFARAHLRD